MFSKLFHQGTWKSERYCKKETVTLWQKVNCNFLYAIYKPKYHLLHLNRELGKFCGTFFHFIALILFLKKCFQKFKSDW